jgi:hypothetical protein
MRFFKCGLLLSPVQAYLAVAIATIYRSAFTGLERYFGVFATLGTHRGEHLPLAPETVATTTLAVRFPCLTTGGTALGVVFVPLGCEELLFLSAERESGVAIEAC